MQSLRITELKVDDKIRVKTASGNTYWLSIVDPAKRLASLYRCEGRPRAESEGWRGQRYIVSPIEVGKPMQHTYSTTTPVVSIDLNPTDEACPD